MPVQGKRRHPRFVVEGLHGKVMLSTEVEILNMSMGGAAVSGEMRFNMGREYSLRLDIGEGGRTVQLKGVVVWSTLCGVRHNDLGESVSQYTAGLKFTNVMSEELERLLEFIDAVKLTPEKRLAGVRFRVQSGSRGVIDSTHAYQVILISLSGMLIRTENELELEGVLPMELVPNSEAPIHFAGRVASAFELNEAVPPCYEIGIEFVDIAEEDRARLETFVTALSAS